MIKKILLGIVFAVLFCLTSCSNLVKDCSSQKKLLDNYNFGVYSDISESFSEILKYQGSLTEKSRNLFSADSDNNDSYYFFDIEDGMSSAVFLIENGYITDVAFSYIQEIENSLGCAENSLEDIFDAISEIEIRALGNLEGKDLDNVMYYAEISKSSLEYFCSECDLSESRGIFSRIRKKIPKKIQCAVISAAAGAVVGGIIGVGIGSVANFPVVGQTGFWSISSCYSYWNCFRESWI